MPQIVSTPRLRELESHAGALPFARSKSDRLEKELEAAQRKIEELERDLEKLLKTTAKELADGVAQVREANQRTYDAQMATNRANDKVTELQKEIERLRGKLTENPRPEPSGVVGRYLNQTGAHVDITLLVTDTGRRGGVGGSRIVDLRLVAGCTGCGEKNEDDAVLSEGVYDSPDARHRYIRDDWNGGRMRRWAQSHAETCRAVALNTAA
ncbi:hypothetical protein ACJ6WE_39985 [Streptomyces sp. MMS24-I31]|uniref:hypothetical protein n=1 Tax=Streptomyces sp. MMS24-I31 TaxID=3351563 RepID=UPI003896A97B